MRDYDGETAGERIAKRRGQLVAAGFELFGEHGYAGTSIRSILHRAGLRDRYFRESFDDLDALLAAVYAQLIAEEVAACRSAIAASSGGSAGARALIDTLTRSLEGNAGRARIKLREVVSGGPAARRQRKEGLQQISAMVADLLPGSPLPSSRDRLLLGAGVVAAADEWLLAWLDGDHGLTREDVIDHVMLFFDAVADKLATDAARDAVATASKATTDSPR